MASAFSQSSDEAQPSNVANDTESTSTDIELDRAFARMLYHEPALPLDESARLRFERQTHRFYLLEVQPGSVAWDLGLRSGDQLESINGSALDSLERARKVFIESRRSTSLCIRIVRQSQWLDVELTFVP